MSNYEHIILVFLIPLISFVILVWNFVHKRKTDIEKNILLINDMRHDVDNLKRDFNPKVKEEMIVNNQKILNFEHRMDRLEEMSEKLFELLHHIESKNSNEHNHLDKVLDSHSQHLIKINRMFEKISDKL